jgi:hypothetical protein
MIKIMDKSRQESSIKPFFCFKIKSLIAFNASGENVSSTVPYSAGEYFSCLIKI